jgi:hypothetical protein
VAERRNYWAWFLPSSAGLALITAILFYIFMGPRVCARIADRIVCARSWDWAMGLGYVGGAFIAALIPAAVVCFLVCGVASNSARRSKPIEPISMNFD